MTIAHDLAELARLHDAGALTAEEYARAKANALAAPPDAAALQRQLDAVHRASTEVRRRFAALALALAVIAALFALWSGAQASRLESDAEAVEDVALVEGLGIRIPDPRPAIARAGLELRAAFYRVLAIAGGVVAAAFALLWALLRVAPPRERTSAAPDVPTGGDRRAIR